jgi:hypothetical protein
MSSHAYILYVWICNVLSTLLIYVAKGAEQGVVCVRLLKTVIGIE